MSLQDNQGWGEDVNIGQQLADVLLSACGRLGYELASVAGAAASFVGVAGRLTATYVPRDGDLALRLRPEGADHDIDLVLYLRACDIDLPDVLRYAVAESAANALEIARAFANQTEALQDLLAGDPREVQRALALRWWDVPLPS